MTQNNKRSNLIQSNDKRSNQIQNNNKSSNLIQNNKRSNPIQNNNRSNPIQNNNKRSNRTHNLHNSPEILVCFLQTQYHKWHLTVDNVQVLSVKTKLKRKTNRGADCTIPACSQCKLPLVTVIQCTCLANSVGHWQLTKSMCALIECIIQEAHKEGRL